MSEKDQGNGNEATRYLVDSNKLSPQDLIDRWPGEEKPTLEVAAACLRNGRQILPKGIFGPKFNGETSDALAWVLRGNLLIGKMAGSPLDFVPVVTCERGTLLSLDKETPLELRAGENGAFLIIFPEAMIQAMIQKLGPKLLKGHLRLIQEIVKNNDGQPTAKELEQRREIASLKKFLEEKNKELVETKETLNGLRRWIKNAGLTIFQKGGGDLQKLKKG